MLVRLSVKNDKKGRGSISEPCNALVNQHSPKQNLTKACLFVLATAFGVIGVWEKIFHTDPCGKANG